jgi:4'-phosphopantetheinyl transferase
MSFIEPSVVLLARATPNEVIGCQEPVRYSRVFVPTDDIHIWFRATDQLDQAAIAAAASMLSDEERARYARFHFARDARDYAAAHALLRTVLSRNRDRPPEGWHFDKTPQGKPILIDPADTQASFSLSHAHGMVACAVTDDLDVGVDVECTDRAVNVLDIAARFFSPGEADLLEHLDPGSRCQRFFDLWTLKEALAKALGVGLSTTLSSLVFSVEDASGGITLEAPATIDANAWQFALFAPGPKHRLAVALRRPRLRPAQLILQSAEDGT